MELLTPPEARVLGALLEKEATTPEYYPLSLNALVNACNQKSNRDPVVDYDDATVSRAVNQLREKRLAVTITGGSRVEKYAQRISETLNLGRRELAVLCTLLLRGPQTLGEIKDRSERMFSFADLSEAQTLLDKLADSAAPLIAKLPRQPGQKEARYAHLLCGPPSIESLPPPQSASSPTADRITELEHALSELRSDFEALKLRFEALEVQLK